MTSFKELLDKAVKARLKGMDFKTWFSKLSEEEKCAFEILPRAHRRRIKSVFYSKAIV